MKAKRLGVVLAGGQSRRFGSDKALALLDGRPLIELAVENLVAWCDLVVITGRRDGPVPCLPDWPEADMGPLAGLAAALRHARSLGFDEVLSTGVDSPDLSPELIARLSPAPSYVAGQPVIALWSVAAASVAEEILTGEGRHSMFAMAERAGARAVEAGAPPANINFPEDLAALQPKPR